MNAANSLFRALGGRIDADLHGRLRQILRRVVVGHGRIQLVFSIANTRAVLGVARPSGIWPTNEPEDGEFSVVIPSLVFAEVDR